MTYYDEPPTTGFRLMASGTEHNAAIVTCEGAWMTNDDRGDNFLKCTDTDVNVMVVNLTSYEVDAYISLKYGLFHRSLLSSSRYSMT